MYFRIYISRSYDIFLKDLFTRRDKYDNPIEDHLLPNIIPRITFQLWYIDSTDGGVRKRYENKANFLIYQTLNTNTLMISVAFSPSEEGWYEARVLLDQEPIASGGLTLIVLSAIQNSKVEQILSNRKTKDFYALESDYFEADLICQNGQKLDKTKKVCTYTVSTLVMLFL